MASKKLLTILGATGNQGGSVIDVVLANPEFQQKYRLRGVTRNASSASAQELTKKGVEMVSASVNDVEALKSAFRGSWGVFAVTVRSNQNPRPQKTNDVICCRTFGTQT
jgi:uncharacterized protein YbjT (DUF2867 family)